MRGRPTRECGDDGIDGRKLRHHPDLDGLDVEIAEHGVHLRSHEIRRHRMNPAHAACVLGGQGGDDRGAVDAERRKRLQVGLDAGAT